MGITGILCSFILVLKGETGKEMPKSSRLEFLEKYLANNFASSDTKGNTPPDYGIEEVYQIYLCREDY